MAPSSMRRCVLLLLTTSWLAACTTVRVRTDPPDAAIEANGVDISETGEIQERPGFRPHDVTVSRHGYVSKRVAIPRDHMVGWLKWLSLVGSVGCSSVCACVGCAVCGA